MNRFFKDGMTMLFQGDSVTDAGRNRSIPEGPLCLGEGYPDAFFAMYGNLFPDNMVRFVNRGVSGDRTNDLLERYEKDFKEVNPDIISIMIGINNTWRNFDGGADYCSAERFEEEYEELLAKIKADMPDTKIMIIEQFALTAHPDRNTWQEDLDAKREVTRKLAFKYADWFVPMYDIITEAAENDFDLYELSPDGVHPGATGHKLIAVEMLKAFEII
ncbi:MAG: GDSL family lipase [Clostridia bacterium]|nr:GDSL family lipase [Clostridia bacterium]